MYTPTCHKQDKLYVCQLHTTSVYTYGSDTIILCCIANVRALEQIPSFPSVLSIALGVAGRNFGGALVSHQGGGLGPCGHIFGQPVGRPFRHCVAML